MPFYESVYLMRQDASTTDVDKFVEDFTKISAEYDVKIVKHEYWGLRSLAYEIQNNKKAHYTLLVSEGNDAENNRKFLLEIDRRAKLNENIIRSLITKVDAVDKEPSPILKNKNNDNEEVVNVTVNKDA